MICVFSSGNILEFDEKRRFIHQFPINFYGIDIAIDAEGNLILLGPSENKIFHVYDKKGNHLYSFGEGFEIPEEFSKFKESRLFKLPLRLWAIENEIYILNPYRYEIHIYRDGKFNKKLSKDTPDSLRPEIKEAVPGGIAVYASDNLFHKHILGHKDWSRKRQPMKEKFFYLLILIFLFTTVVHISCKQQKAKWQGTIEEIDGVTVVNNPNEPLYGELVFDLEEDLSIGSKTSLSLF